MTASPGLTALLDQVDAASRQVAGNLRRQADAGGLALGHTSDPWARRLVATLLDNHRRGRLRFCPHVATPRPVVTAAWRLTDIACERCAPALFDLSGSPEDSVCDRCHADTRGAIHPGVFAVGPVVVIHGLCSPCHGLLAAAAWLAG